MSQTFFNIYTAVALFLSAIDFYYAVRAFKKPSKLGRALGWTASCAAVITLAYVASVNVESPLWVSVSSSIVFAGIDCLLISIAAYAMLATGLIERRRSLAVMNALRVLAAVDIGVLISNIFTGAAVGYERLEPFGITYVMKPLYVAHLVLTYALVLVALGILLYKSAKTPAAYRNQYLVIVLAIEIVVVINAVFLSPAGSSFFTKVDCSILGYSVGLYLMYWTAFEYRENNMVRSLSATIVENINQGIVLFDYAGELIMANRRAAALLGEAACVRGTRDADFSETCGIAPEALDKYSTQCDVKGGLPLRCDFNRLRDRRGRAIGELYVFTDISRDHDITTGFEYAHGHRALREKAARIGGRAAIAVFDIVGLREINRRLGRDEGDRRIRALAKDVRRRMPEGATLLRGYEAYLIAVCPGAREADLLPAAQEVVAAAENLTMVGLSAVDGAPPESAAQALCDALDAAYRSIQIKKLLSADSVRSQALASLVQALQAADADTESHVRRTQKMGALLGRRIGLNDVQLTQLELLCLLHDIGKIGIPLEILNKPGRLAEQEWEVLRTHPDKGYQIAMSSDELKDIAEMILYHHERWDGKGYPKGLAGAQIPILSRIIAVVDAYDAMVNDRSYRKALSPETAQAEIRNNAGTQFDPDLAREFLALLDEHPELAVGEKVGKADAAVSRFAPQDADTGYTAPIAYSRYQLDGDNVIIEVDDRFEEITGYTRADVVGRMVQADLVPPEERAFYLIQVSRQFTHGDMAYLRHEILRKDGERVQVACYGRLYYDSAAKAYRNEIIIFRL